MKESIFMKQRVRMLTPNKSHRLNSANLSLKEKTHRINSANNSIKVKTTKKRRGTSNRGGGYSYNPKEFIDPKS